jgi:hypothetical protein
MARCAYDAVSGVLQNSTSRLFSLEKKDNLFAGFCKGKKYEF